MTDEATKVEWEVDDRGKPCKWRKKITITAEDLVEGRIAQKREEVAAALRECQQAVHALVESGEYVAIVEPEVVIDRVTDRFDQTGSEVVTVRARVRWITHEAKQNRERNLNAMFDAVDDELTNGPS